MHSAKTTAIVFVFTISLFNVFGQATPVAKEIKVSQQRMEGRILELAKFGRDSIGRGYRVAYTRGDQEARAWYIGLLKKSGLEVSIDAA